MRVLIAEDDSISRKLLSAAVSRWGHELVETTDGRAALAELLKPGHIQIAILDWMMPELDGVEVIRRLRAEKTTRPVYVILLTAKEGVDNIVQGLTAGADDYLTKPFDRNELKARLDVGIRIVELQEALAARVAELEKALSEVKQLKGLLPICSYCKKIRNDENYWEQLEVYISQHTEAEFSHGICPSCYKRIVEPQISGP